MHQGMTGTYIMPILRFFFRLLDITVTRVNDQPI